MSKYCGKFGICHKKKAIAAAVLAASLAAQNMMPVMAGGGDFGTSTQDIKNS